MRTKSIGVYQRKGTIGRAAVAVQFKGESTSALAQKYAATPKLSKKGFHIAKSFKPLNSLYCP